MSELSKKPEKLASALYLITSFFDDHEPLKWRLRTLASEFIALGILIKDTLFKEGEAVTLKTRNLILEITSLISVARNVGLISDTNYSLLHQELTKYLNLLGLPAGMSEENGHMSLSANVFGIESREIKEVPKTEELALKDKSFDRSFDHPRQLLPSRPSISDKGQSLKEFGAVSVKKNSRQSTIIAILKRKKEIMIKDVSPIISGCSEKTIQRELSAMVQAGILKKVGEKRWSRYSLA